MERDDDVISLQDYLVVLRRQRWIVLTVAVLVVVAALAVSLAQTPLYEADSEVVLEPVRRTQDVSLEELLAPSGNNVVQTERLVVTSRPVAERVVEQLGLPDTRTAVDAVRVEAIADTRVVRIVATDPDPAAAAELADAFATSYLDFRRDDAVEGLLAARAGLEARADALRDQIAALEDEGDDADDGQAAATETGEDTTTTTSTERDALLSQLAQISTQAAELGSAAGDVSGGGSILTPAEVPVSPVSPQPVRTGALAIVLGLLLGVGVAFLRDHVDDVVRDENDFKRATGGRPILGRIPGWSDPDGGERLATVVEPASLASEAYRELSAGVRFLLVAHGDAATRAPQAPDATGERLGRSIIVCSSVAGDGKTSTAANLAVAAARVGMRTLLVDADLRRSTVAKRFGMPRGTGLSDLLLSGGDLDDQVLDVGVDNLRVLPAGTIPPNPNELLASPAMHAVHHQILRQVDLVIYDTPAVLAVPDALELGRHVDFAVLVGRAGTTGRRQLQAALERLTQVGTDVAGTVLNDISGKADGYYYAYYYAEDTTAPAGSGDNVGKASKKAAKKAAKAGAASDRDDRPVEPSASPASPAPATPARPHSPDAPSNAAPRSSTVPAADTPREFTRVRTVPGPSDTASASAAPPASPASDPGAARAASPDPTAPRPPSGGAAPTGSALPGPASPSSGPTPPASPRPTTSDPVPTSGSAAPSGSRPSTPGSSQPPAGFDPSKPYVAPSAAPSPRTERPDSSQPAADRPSSPQPASSQPAPSQPAADRPSSPQPAPSRPAADRATSSQPASPETERSAHPRHVAPPTQQRPAERPADRDGEQRRPWDDEDLFGGR